MSWLIPSIPRWANTTTPSPNAEAGPSTGKTSTHAILSEEDTEEDQDDLDAPAAFPALNSAQRSQPKLSKNNDTPDSPPAFEISPPSPSHSRSSSTSSSKTLSPPKPTRSLPASSSSSSNNPASLPTPTTTTTRPNPYLKKRQKVALQPGCSALDWAKLKGGREGSSGELRGEEGRRGFPLRVTMEELKRHNTQTDAWSAFNGRVYNITPYMRFHPGGERELMRCAGRDGTKLFMATHAWVNVEFMMDVCLVGMLVSDDSGIRRLL